MNNTRGYSFLEIKSLDNEQRILTGMASVPEVDRVGDIVESLGASFAAEIPLLLGHSHDKPVGIAELGKPTKKGISFRAIIARIDEDGELKRLTDYAWQSVKAGLIKGVSIGFRPKEYEVMKEGGLRFTKSEIYELSLVSVPACASATIQTIKALSGYRSDESRGAVPLIDRFVEKPDDMKGAVKLISAKRLASLPLKASR